MEESMDKAWQGAEAYHLWLLGQRQLLTGSYTAALRTALNTRRYTDILDARSVYLFLLLAALCSGYLGVAAKALMKLESMVEIPQADRSSLTALATAIFVDQAPEV
jgi:WD repeat-containing protein 35